MEYRLLALCSILVCSEAYRILVVFPLPWKSHSILGHGVVNHLLAAGHEVVHITAYPKEKPIPKLKEISLKPLRDKLQKQTEEDGILSLKNMDGKSNIGNTVKFTVLNCFIIKAFLEEPYILEFFNDPTEKFDVVIIEWFFSYTNVGIASLFESPLIWLGTTEAHWEVMEAMDEITNPAYTVNLFSAKQPPLSLWERAMELWAIIRKSVIKSLVVTPIETWIYNRVFTDIALRRGVSLPSYSEAKYNASLMFLNSHPSIGTPYRLPQSVKYIGGFHVDDQVEPLPKNIQTIMDSKNGVIYFSMGSALLSKDMSDEMRNSLLEMFGKLKETVIWKFETDLDGIKIPANVYLIKWVPQQSILAHPNLKIFITHGGQLSTIEAIHHAVPVIGIPVLGDQYVNMRSVESKGFGISIAFGNNLANRLAPAIKTMLSNSQYKIKAQELSKIYHHRPVPPGKELVHWVEHVVQTRGALHLRSPALMVPWYQKMYLDLAFVIVFLLVILYSIFKQFKIKLLAKKKDKTN